MAIRRPRKRFPSIPHLVPIVNDASIAGPVVEGVNIPLVILDTSERPDIDEIIRVHEQLSSGDVRYRWVEVDGYADDVLLSLMFERPIEALAVLHFSIEKRGLVVEAALTARAIYLQAGRPGDRLMHDLDRPKILVELPDDDFRERWDEIFLNRMTALIRRRSGLPRRQARKQARRLIQELQPYTTFRMPRKPASNDKADND